ncbi:MAG: 1-acyl-sn-glycerol-3-phosphate acyltransferase, partial [Bacteroidia bacterium]|nr:1-acyl-sn-glycerol-3-phosphate acyltransferase [Bacteroidia bacterium]
MKVLRAIHTGYGFVVFSLVFALLLPFLLVPIIDKRQFHLVGIINRIWAKVVLALVALPWKAELRSPLDPKRQYIFCPNHFSYIDIPTLGLNPVNAVFVGKSEMEGIPLFGWMYRNLHITVDRTKLKSKYATLVKSLEALDKGKS